MRTARHVLRFHATLAGFEDGSNALLRLLDEQQISGQPRFDIELAFEEIAVNIVRHGRPNADVEVAIDFDDSEVVLTFVDDGIAFDPLTHPDPPAPASIEDAQVGGLGVMLVKKLATRLAYERTAHRNRLMIAIPTR